MKPLFVRLLSLVAKVGVPLAACLGCGGQRSVPAKPVPVRWEGVETNYQSTTPPATVPVKPDESSPH